MLHEIRRIHNQIKATSVFVTHDQHEGMILADRIVIMNKGTIEQVGTPEDIYNHPASTFVAGFIGSPAMNFLPGVISAAQQSVLLPGDTRLDISAEAALGHDDLLVQAGLRPEQITLARPDQPGPTNPARPTRPD